MSTHTGEVPGPARSHARDVEGAAVLDAAAWSAAAPYLPPLLLDALARHPDRPPNWIESVEGTMAFADISGFTPLSERLAQMGKEGAERLTNIINGYFQRMLDITGDYGGSHLKFGGDALLLQFSGEAHARRAVRAALDMQRANREMSTVVIGRDRIRLKMSIGIHSGTFWSAAAGLPGRRMQHFIFGRDVCRVAETEATARGGEVVVSDATLSLLGKCATEPRGEAYRVLRLSGRVAAPPAREYDLPAPALGADLLAYLPPPIVRALRTGDRSAAIEGEHRKVTIIFINVLGIEERMEQLGPEAALADLQSYLSLVVELADKYGGFLAANDVYLRGIKLILVFGAPVAHEQDSANSLRLAIELHERLPEVSEHLQHRIGINSGFVFAGDVGSAYRREYTVIGDATNLAARLMSATTPDQILASKQVVAEAGPSFVVRELEPARVKGKKDPIPICAVEGERVDVPAPAAAEAAALFGREAELESLREECRRVEAGMGRTTLITGEAGIGKSRLVQEFESHLSGRGWTVHRGAVLLPHDR